MDKDIMSCFGAKNAPKHLYHALSETLWSLKSALSR